MKLPTAVGGNDNHQTHKHTTQYQILWEKYYDRD